MMINHRGIWGEAIHTGLRKACDTPSANILWHVIRNADKSTWESLTAYCGEKWAEGKDPVMVMLDWCGRIGLHANKEMTLLSFTIYQLTIVDVAALQEWMKEAEQ